MRVDEDVSAEQTKEHGVRQAFVLFNHCLRVSEKGRFDENHDQRQVTPKLMILSMNSPRGASADLAVWNLI